MFVSICISTSPLITGKHYCCKTLNIHSRSWFYGETMNSCKPLNFLKWRCVEKNFPFFFQFKIKQSTEVEISLPTDDFRFTIQHQRQVNPGLVDLSPGSRSAKVSHLLEGSSSILQEPQGISGGVVCP